jgi:hypothetical protein
MLVQVQRKNKGHLHSFATMQPRLKITVGWSFSRDELERSLTHLTFLPPTHKDNVKQETSALLEEQGLDWIESLSMEEQHALLRYWLQHFGHAIFQTKPTSGRKRIPSVGAD